MTTTTAKQETAEDRFRDLYHQTSPRVYAYLRRQTTQDEAESVLSDVYLKAWRHFDSLEANPMGWLITAAKTTLLDHWRAKQRQDRLADDFAALARHESVAAVEGLALDRTLMLQALRQLSDNDREALLLVGWDGLDHQSAADAAGCTVSAFTARINRARTRLVELLGDSTAQPTRPHLRALKKEA